MRLIVLLVSFFVLTPVWAWAARLEGRVSAAEGIDALPALSVAIDDWICGNDGELPDPRMLIGAGRGLANVVVRVLDVDDAEPYRSEERAVIDQNGCVFTPHVVVVAPGAELLVRNSDPVLHNFRVTADLNPRLNRAQVRGKEDVLRFAAPEIIRAECDVHYWMSAVIVVAASAHTAVTGSDGSFAIDGLAPGTYSLELWHERLGSTEVTATVTAEGGRVDFEWPEPVAPPPG